MRPLSTILLLLAIILIPQIAFSQEITGKWRGYFSPNNSSGSRVFTYEVNFTPTNGTTLSITTLSKLNNEFAAKAYGTGSINGAMIQFNETSFDMLKLGSSSQGCLMTCYLYYKNIRGLDILEGTYTSQSTDGVKDCGGGTIYLQKNQSVEKTIADITPKKKTNAENTSTTFLETKKVVAKKGVKNNIDKPSSAASIIQKTSNNTIENVNPKNSNSEVNKNTQINPNNLPISTSTEKTIQVNPTTNLSAAKTAIESKAPSNTDENTVDNIPWVLVGRENKLVKQITTISKQFSIDLYDNGTIDNDTINVYDNKKLLANLKRLSDKPIHLEFSFNEKIKQHEVIITAHNMGLVPPNTALLVLKENGNRQELFITTTNTFNAKIVIQYTPPN